MVSSEESKGFDYEAYWNDRLNKKFNIEGVGYLGLGKIYNRFMYRMRFEILDYIIERLDLNINKADILELGPGTGIFTRYFQMHDANNYTGIDIAEKSVVELKKQYEKYSFIKGDICDEAYYKGNSYDLVFAADVLLHITDEEKYKSTIRNFTRCLKAEGFCILYDPISMINTKSESNHVTIRDFKYVKNTLADNGLELVQQIPVFFFMNNPFDSKLLKDNSPKVVELFSLIKSIFKSKELSDEAKKLFGEYIFIREKQLLCQKKLGVSEKLLIIKKNSNSIYVPQINMSEIWDINKMQEEVNIIMNKIDNNYELKSNQIVNDLVALIQNL
ncbi:class I SAM-dependent methyltransferase [Brassicibacter mesophilus]|uniref:class I SAM-dependent methyltransferase n=1 Tax=Brassicibacter mesophilus TaxID=745119 RepID=UPI003D236B30